MMGIQIPESFKDLFKPKRFKVFYGGRGAAKSHNFARALLTMGVANKLRILCARELQGSIADSVHKLLSDIIDETPEFSAMYTVQKSTILGRNGTEFIFKGLKHNATEIKSTEGVDYCWVEEAEIISSSSWELLIPTIRKEDSEIWLSFNCKHPSDPTYQRFVKNADEDMIVKKVSWRDNPFFPDVLNNERLRLKRNDPQAYNHIWEGEFDERREGYILSNVIKQAREQGRITSVPYKSGIPVIAAWELGKRHSTCIWFAQVVGLEVRVLDYYDVNGDDADVDKIAEYVRALPYKVSQHFLPHDGGHARLGMKGSIKDQLRLLGLNCRVIPVNVVSKSGGIQLAKTLIKECYIDKDKCVDGLHCLDHYHYEWDDNKMRFKDNPFDDWSCDAADAFRYLAVALDKFSKECTITDVKSVTIPSISRGNSFSG